MKSQPNRRGFLRETAALASCLALRPLNAARAEQAETSASSPQGIRPGLGRNSLISVIIQNTSRDVNPRATAWCYITEVLRRAGLFFRQASPDGLSEAVREPKSLILLAGDLRLTTSQRDMLVEFVKNGGALIGIGGTSGMDEVFGVRGTSRLAEGWIRVSTADHPVTAGLRSSLHVFGGCTANISSATSLATVESASHTAKGQALVENRFGLGIAMLLAPDLLFSIVHIQQGHPVFQDTRPDSAETALTNEGILKAEDGLALDWLLDRQPMQPDNVPVFLEPVSDELREIILRSIFHLARQRGIVLPLLWYWPRGLKAVAHLSHDTDGNDPEKAKAMLECVNRCKVKSTWCTLFPGGYPKDFYQTLRDQQFEIALHYDALAGEAKTSWSKENFAMQREWLLKEAGLNHITSNKNHYTRWEGRLDFYRWCEEVGINSDQTRGPSKKGTIGFPLGGSQPYFPLDDERDSPRLMNVLEVNMLTQDLVVVCPAEYGHPLLDSATRHHGVAHFLFHPAHIQKPNVADTLAALVDYGRAQGLEWWTNAQIFEWETLRRTVQAEAGSDVLNLQAPNAVKGATLLFLSASPSQIRVNQQLVPGERRNLYGFEFDAVQVDLEGKTTVQMSG